MANNSRIQKARRLLAALAAQALLIAQVSTFALAQTIIGADDFAGGASNPSGVLGSVTVDTDVYTAASTSPFTTYSAASLPAPQSGQTYVGRVQWAVEGQNELEPFGSVATFERTEFYAEYEYYIPTGFPFCGGKWMRGGRQVSEVYVDQASFIESAPEDTAINSSAPPWIQNLVFGPGEFELNDNTTNTARDEWQRLGVHIKYNTFTGSTPNADGFVKLYINRVLESEHTGVTWSDDVANAAGFNGWRFLLNHSYAACTVDDAAPSDGAVFVAGFVVYDTFPGSGGGGSSSSSSSSSGGTTSNTGGSFVGAYY